MGAARKLNIDIIRGLIPLNSLAPINLQKLLPKINIITLAKNQKLFKIGHRDSFTYYLLDGEMEMIAADKSSYLISHGEEIACHPLAHYQPRQVTAVTLKKCTIAKIDSNLLDVLLTWDQSSGYEVADIESNADGSDWMTKLLQSKYLEKLPPANIQKLLLKMEETVVPKGHSIINEGELGEQYYLIKKGQATVTKTSKSGNKVIVADLSEGDFFGEDALLSNEKRNATVMMTTDGIVMSLNKQDFDSLIKTPLINNVNYEQAADISLQGAIWVDVRMPDEYKHNKIYGSQNIPLFAIRQNVGILDMGKPYIVYCDTGRRSAAAGFLLSQRGFDVYVLTGGISSVPEQNKEISKTDAPARKDANSTLDQKILSKQKNEIEFLKGDVEQLNMQLNQAKQRTIEFEKLLRVKDTELHKLEKTSVGHQSFDAIERQLQEKTKHYESQLLINDQQKNEIERYKESVKALTRSIDEAEERYNHFRQSKQKVDDLEVMTIVNAEIKKYKLQLELSKKRIHELCEEKTCLSKSLTELKFDNDKLKETQPLENGEVSGKDELTEQLYQTQEKLEQALAEIEVFKNQSQDEIIKHVLTEKIQLQKQLDKLNTDLDANEKLNQRLQAALETNQSEIDKLQEKINKLSAEKTDLINNNRRLHNDYELHLEELKKGNSTA